MKSIFIIFSVFFAVALITFTFLSVSLLEKSGANDLDIAQSLMDQNIVVFTPKAGGVARQGSLIVRGKARVFENQVQVRIIAKGETIYENSVITNAQSPERFGNFGISIPLSAKDLSGTQSLLLEVFDYSPRDGSEIDMFMVPLLVR
ncbi:MAG: Gmad2 immunoglobulin-like domain-containing protein [Candidatus Liptonbacteria bacterium]|nr:Gmad2 immunoglobulin-like domain-containing protein [Candidatus Liptonbacteria bacterium]